MDTRHAGLLLVLGLCAAAYAARRGGDLWQGYADGREHAQMCATVNRIVLNGKFEESSKSKLPLEVAFAKKYCWKTKT